MESNISLHHKKVLGHKVIILKTGEMIDFKDDGKCYITIHF